MPYQVLARTTEVRPGQPKRIELLPDRVPYAIAIFQTASGYYAIEDRCTHVEYPLSEGEVQDDLVICPLHGACFELKTGQPTCGPCNGPVMTFPLRISGEQIEVDLDVPIRTNARS